MWLISLFDLYGTLGTRIGILLIYDNSKKYSILKLWKYNLGNIYFLHTLLYVTISRSSIDDWDRDNSPITTAIICTIDI